MDCINVIQIKGKMHRVENKDCEDTFLIEENEKLYFIGVADGKSGSCYGKRGGEIALRCLMEYVGKKGIDLIVNSKYKDEERYEIIKKNKECTTNRSGRI